MTAGPGVILVKKVTYFREFGDINSSCIRRSIILIFFFLIPWEINSRFCSKTQRQMFLLVSGRHVSAHLDEHQHTPYADMVHWPFVARDELCKSEARWASVFWFDNASPERSCLVGDLVCLISLWVFCVTACHQKTVKSSTGKYDYF